MPEHICRQSNPPDYCVSPPPHPRQSPLDNNCIGQLHVDSCAASRCAPDCVLCNFEPQLAPVLRTCSVSLGLSVSIFVVRCLVVFCRLYDIASATLLCCGRRWSHLPWASKSIKAPLLVALGRMQPAAASLNQLFSFRPPSPPEAASTSVQEVLQALGIHSVGQQSSSPSRAPCFHSSACTEPLA